MASIGKPWHERHEARARFDDRHIKLLGDAVAEIGGAQLGKRQRTGGDNQ